MDKVNISSISDILDSLEQELYLNWTFPYQELSLAGVKTKILNFSEFLRDTGRLSLSCCRDKLEYEEVEALLVSLKENITHTLCELEQFHNKGKYKCICCKCNQSIYINPKRNFWTCLQEHEHFEFLYSQFLKQGMGSFSEELSKISLESTDKLIDTSKIDQENMETSTQQLTKKDVLEQFSYPLQQPVASTSNGECINETTDSDTENETIITDEKHILSTETQNGSENDVNSFRFNFAVNYDHAVQSKIYPHRLLRGVNRFDKIRELTVQIVGPFRAVCLLCSCDLVFKGKISKFIIENHTMGQRHIRFAHISENINNLKRYHEFWLNLDPVYQAFQVYFKPVSSGVKCSFCNSFVTYDEILSHVQLDSHKNKIINMFEKKANTFYLIDLQILSFGADVVQIETKSQDENKVTKVVPKPKKSTEKKEVEASSDTKEIEHNIIKSVENQQSNNILELIPNRYKEHVKFFKSTGQSVSCSICKVLIPKDISKMKLHIVQNFHLDTAAISTKKYRYYCEICNIKIPNETAWILHFNGPNKHARIAESRKDKVTEYECVVCCTVIYGDELSLNRHLLVGSKRGQRSKGKEINLPDEVKKVFKSKEVIEITAESLTQQSTTVLTTSDKTQECCARLEETLNAVFEECKIFPFGSRISGLGDEESDLDIFLDIGDMYTGYNNQDALCQVQLVRKAANAFIKNKIEFKEVFQIPTARTPIVSVLHIPTNIRCDISFRHGLGVENTKFVKFCLSLQPIAQPFILMLKKWSHLNLLTEHISTYAIALMAIFYLQTKNYLLPVKKIKDLNPEESLIIYDWETIKYTVPLEEMKKYVEPYPDNVCTLLKDFFSYYAKFNYAEDVICPLLGHTILKKDIIDLNLPDEMRSYVDQLNNENPEPFRALAPMCTQDPFDLSHNLTKACQIGTVHKFKALCELTFKHIDSLE